MDGVFVAFLLFVMVGGRFRLCVELVIWGLFLWRLRRLAFGFIREVVLLRLFLRWEFGFVIRFDFVFDMM